jgi:DNA-binding IclR family transcriptional regulator
MDAVRQMLEPAITRVRAEFQEMPCLRVSPAEAQRLFGLAPALCDEVLETLVAEGSVSRDAQRRYGRVE